MLLKNFENLHVADGEIVSYHSEKDKCIVVIKDWREKKITVTFTGVYTVQDMGAINEDLSHCKVSDDDPFMKESEKALGEKLKNVHCFTFWSAWRDAPNLKILAERFKIQERD